MSIGIECGSYGRVNVLLLTRSIYEKLSLALKDKAILLLNNNMASLVVTIAQY
jgi:hypothetical protein